MFLGDSRPGWLGENRSVLLLCSRGRGGGGLFSYREEGAGAETGDLGLPFCKAREGQA